MGLQRVSHAPGWGRQHHSKRDPPFVPSKRLPDWASLLVQMIKNLSAVQETWVQFLGWEDPLEMGVANHTIILAWRIP